MKYFLANMHFYERKCPKVVGPGVLLDFSNLFFSIWERIGSTGSVYSGFGNLIYTVPAVNRVNIGRLHDNNKHQMV